MNARNDMWQNKNFSWLRNYIDAYDDTLFDVLCTNARDVNEVYSSKKAMTTEEELYIGKVPHLHKYIIHIKTPKGKLVLNKGYHDNTYIPMVCGVLNTDEYVNHRNLFVINGMSENDVINFLEELYK